MSYQFVLLGGELDQLVHDLLLLLVNFLVLDVKAHRQQIPLSLSRNAAYFFRFRLLLFNVKLEEGLANLVEVIAI